MEKQANRSWHPFDPQKLARLEKENYVAYYQKDWLKLLRVSIELVKEAFGLSLWQSTYGAYLMARAEMAAAPYPNNNIPLAEEYARRFFALIARIHHLEIDAEQAARVEVHWWVVHRRQFGNPDNEELVDALTKSYALAYDAPQDRLRQAAYHRAQGILYSDYWVNQGKQPDSPLLAQEEEELCRGYVALRAALTPP